MFCHIWTQWAGKHGPVDYFILNLWLAHETIKAQSLLKTWLQLKFSTLFSSSGWLSVPRRQHAVFIFVFFFIFNLKHIFYISTSKFTAWFFFRGVQTVQTDRGWASFSSQRPSVQQQNRQMFNLAASIPEQQQQQQRNGQLAPHTGLSCTQRFVLLWLLATCCCGSCLEIQPSDEWRRLNTQSPRNNYFNRMNRTRRSGPHREARACLSLESFAWSPTQRCKYIRNVLHVAF